MTLQEETVVKRKNKMPFLNPEELKPKLKEIFETQVVPQIVKAKIMDTELTAVNSLLETLLPFIDRSRVSDTFIHTVTEVHLAMEKDQIKDAFVECWKANVPDGIECKLDAEQYYNETFKSE